jgi:hypothetical protein
MSGELHFGWVLGGRAVQDIWIVPSAATRAPPLADGQALVSSRYCRRS